MNTGHRQRGYAIVIVMGVLASLAMPARAAVNWLSQDRHVRSVEKRFATAYGSSLGYTDSMSDVTTTSPGWGDFNTGALVSTIAPSGITANGYSNFTTPVDAGILFWSQRYVESATTVTFHLTSPTSYTLASSASCVAGYPVGGGLVPVPREDWSSNQFWLTLEKAGTGLIIGESGILDPGDYTFSVGAALGEGPWGADYADLNYSANLAFTPEPAAMSILLLGTLLFARRVRRTSRDR